MGKKVPRGAAVPLNETLLVDLRSKSYALYGVDLTAESVANTLNY